MQDIKLTSFDISFEDGDLKQEDGFDTALYVSLFSDARAPESLVTVPENRRGWIVDTESIVNGRSLGGLLWLVDQRRLTQKTLNAAVDYARKSLSWMIEDGLLTSIEVTGTIVPRSGIQLEITPIAKYGKLETRYYNLWELTGN